MKNERSDSNQTNIIQNGGKNLIALGRWNLHCLAMPDADHTTSAVIAATVERFRGIAREYAANSDRIAELQKRQEMLSQQAQQCYATAALFNFELLAEMARLDASPNSPVVEQSPPVPAPSLPPAKSQTVREFILEVAQASYPNPVRAADLRQQLELQGKPTHEKTIGMTLYRLARDEGAMRREGKADWYFVPEDQRTSTTESKGDLFKEALG